MTGDELTSLSLVEATRLIRSSEVSPVELTQAYLERIILFNQQFNCFITVLAEQVIAQARLAEAAVKRGENERGEPLGLLHGVPIALKDLYETKGIRTTAGSRLFADYYPESDGFVVRKLRQSGAVILGKTNMHEIALGLTSSNPHFGVCRNPWAPARIPGGSSGGSAAALSARMCAGALGSDTGGSIRIPAALCGIVGLKPSYGRVSLGGVLPLSWNLDHAGPMARQVLDAAILFQVISGYDSSDPYSLDVPLENYHKNIRDGVRGWRVGLSEGEYFERTDPEVNEIVQKSALVLEELGARIIPVKLPDMYEAALANGVIVNCDAAAVYREQIENNLSDFGEDIQFRLKRGAGTKLQVYIQARHTQVTVRRKFDQLFEEFDLILLPTAPVTAPLIVGQDAIEAARLLTRYTAPFNLTGLPAISIPCGFSTEGLPVGLQMVAKSWREAQLLQAAYAYEQATRWFEVAPEL